MKLMHVKSWASSVIFKQTLWSNWKPSEFVWSNKNQSWRNLKNTTAPRKAPNSYTASHIFRVVTKTSKSIPNFKHNKNNLLVRPHKISESTLIPSTWISDVGYHFLLQAKENLEVFYMHTVLVPIICTFIAIGQKEPSKWA